MIQIRAVVFDLDGTLWQPQSIVLPAYKEVFSQLDVASPSDDVLLETLGHPFDVIWKKVLPGADADVVARAHSLMISAERHYLHSVDVAPFPGVIETLQQLRRRGVDTYILSNCQRDYLEVVPDRLGIGELFTARYCAEDYPGLSKAEIIRAVRPPVRMPAVMVGDRFHDMEAGRENGLITIACRFGFGHPDEFVGADYSAASFLEVQETLGDLLNG
jgi:phosphoglycolate phosphatase